MPADGNDRAGRFNEVVNRRYVSKPLRFAVAIASRMPHGHCSPRHKYPAVR
jgi:hypothetical protein